MTYQRNRGLTLLQNYSQSLENYQNALNAAGTAEQKFGIYQESTAAKMDRAKASIEGFWQHAIDSNTIKLAIDAFTKLIDILDILVNSSMGSFLVQATLVSSALGVLYIGTKSLAGVTGFASLITSIGRLLYSFKLVATGASTLKFEMYALKASFATFLPTAIIIGLGLVIEAFIKTKNAAKQAKEEYSKAIDAFNTSQAELDNIKSLKAEYDSLNNKVTQTAQEKQRLIQVQNELTSIFPNLKGKIDAEGNSLIEDNKQLEKNIQLKEKNLSIQSGQLVRKFHLSGNETYQDIQTYQDKIQSLEKSLKTYGEEYQQYAEEYSYLQAQLNTPAIVSRDYADNQKQRLEELSAEMQRVDKIMKGYENTLTNTRKKAKETSEEYRAMTIAFLNQNNGFKSLDNTIKTNLINTLQQLGLSSATVIENLTKTDLPDYLNKMSGAINNFKDTGDLNNFNQSFANFKKEIISIAPTLGITKKEAENFAIAFFKIQDPIGYTTLLLSNFQIAIKAVAINTATATGDIIKAFAILGINISKETAGILQNYTSLIMGITDVATAHQALVQIQSSEMGKLQLTGNPALDMIALSKYSASMGQVGGALNRLGESQQNIKGLSSSGGTDIPKYTPGSSGSSQAEEKELYETKVYENAIAKLDQQLNKLDSTKSKLSENSQAYRDALQQEITLMEQKQTLANQEVERLQNQKSSKVSEINQIAGADWYSLNTEQQQKIFDGLYNPKKNQTQKKFNDLLKDVDSLDKSIVELGNDWTDWQDKIDSNNFSITTSKISELDKKLSILNEDTATYKSQLEVLTPGSQKYNAKLKQIVDSSKEYIKLLQDKQTLIKQELLNDKLSISQKEELSDKLRANTNELSKYVIELRNYLVQIAEAAIDKELDTFKKASDVKIESIQKIIDALEAENNTLEEQETIQERLLAISEAQVNLAKAQQKLSNVQNERNTHIWQNGRWEWVANPKDVKSAQDDVDDANQKLLEAKQSYYDQLEEISKKAEIKALEQQIQAQKQKQDEAEKAAQAKKDLIKTTGVEGNKSLEETLKNSNIILSEGMNSLLSTTSDYVSKMIAELNALIAKQAEAGLSTSTSSTPSRSVTVDGVTITNGVLHTSQASSGLDDKKFSQALAKAWTKYNASYGSGGAVKKTELALVHEGEYMLNRSIVSALGGTSGVERMISGLKSPELTSLRYPELMTLHNNTSTSSNVDKSVKINNLNLSNVTDGSGLIRHLNALSRS